NSRHHINRRWAIKGLLAGNHLVEHTAQTPDVRARVNFKTSRLFGRHVVSSTHHRAGGSVDKSLGWRERVSICGFSIAAQFDEAEVEYFHDAIAAQHDVVRRDVTMNDADTVSCRKCTCDLDSDFECFNDCESA